MSDNLDGGVDVSIDRVEQGTLTAADVVSAEGSLLLPAGRVLTDAVLASLRQCGVRTLRVRPPEADAAEEQREQRLRRLFRHSAGDPAAAELMGMLRDFGRRGSA